MPSEPFVFHSFYDVNAVVARQEQDVSENVGYFSFEVFLNLNFAQALGSGLSHLHEVGLRQLPDFFVKLERVPVRVTLYSIGFRIPFRYVF
jgi:hypothetical protein